MEVEFEFLQKAIRATCIFAVLLTPLAFFFSGISAAFGLIFGAACGSVNLLLIKHLATSLMPGNRNMLRIAGLIAIKFPLFYTLGYLVLAYTGVSPLYSLVGFSLIFIALGCTSMRLSPKVTSVNLLLLAIVTPFSSLQASLTTNVPEVPNIFTFLHEGFHNPLTTFLHSWESVLFSIFLACVIAAIFCYGARRKENVPTSRLQNFLELLTDGMQKFAREILGPEGDKFVPFLGTLFVYILMMNWMVLFPFMKAPSSSLSITAALGICVFALVQYLSVRNFGFFGYLYHMAGSPKGFVGWALVPLMLPIEILTQLSRPLTLAFRLFGNVIGEDILIGAFALFGVTLFTFLPVGLPLQMPFMLFAMLTGLMQALVFTLLSAIYILLSMPDSDNNNH